MSESPADRCEGVLYLGIAVEEGGNEIKRKSAGLFYSPWSDGR
jgi:hypothetical protein